MQPKQLLIVHQGALGDFMLAWPSLLWLSRTFSHVDIRYLGPLERMLFLSPLNIKPADTQLQTAALDLYDAVSWPSGLKDTLVIWYGLRNNPSRVEFDQLWFLPGIINHAPFAPVRQVYLDGLKARGIHIPENWHTAWQNAFRSLPCMPSHGSRYDVLLFPGAGHEKKQWPLVQFFELARRIQSMELKPAFALGPAEMERNLTVRDFPIHSLYNLPQLLALIGSTRIVLGNDCGPVHLAGMMGVPGVGLFGPTSARQWNPWGIVPVSLALACRPCTQTTADITCQRPYCMEKLNIEQVWAAVETLL